MKKLLFVAAFLFVFGMTADAQINIQNVNPNARVSLQVTEAQKADMIAQKSAMMADKARVKGENLVSDDEKVSHSANGTKKKTLVIKENN